MTSRRTTARNAHGLSFVTVAGKDSAHLAPKTWASIFQTGRSEMKYLVIYEASPTGFGAYVPDLPGCVAAGASLDETRDLIAGAIVMHINGLREDGDPIPVPSISEIIEVAV